MSYTILSVAYPLTPVGPDATGGSEHILSLMDRTLTEGGHRSLVLAVEGSQVRGELIAAPKASGMLTEEVRRWGRRNHQQLLLDTLNRYPVDLVHMHSLDFHAYLPASSIPVLATLHLPVSWYPEKIFHMRRRNFFLNCVSSSQQQDCPASEHVQSFIRNGIDVSSFCANMTRGNFVLGLGRICPEKGFHHALDAAKLAGVPMILAGELFPYESHQEYFKKEIAPRLDRDRQFIGPVGAARKRALLGSAKALLVPSLVSETSSLVTMEALASGTPVVAFPVGAVPELVQNGKTGYLVDSMEQMAKAIAKVPRLNSRNCRSAIAEQCDFHVMGKQYLSLYDRLLQGRSSKTEKATIPVGLSWLSDVI